MPRRPAKILQSDVARAIRAARQSGAAGVEIRPDGAIRILLVAPPLAPAGDDLDRELAEFEERNAG
jgi:hypothetical protein